MRRKNLYERISMHGFGPEGRHAFEARVGAEQGLGEREAALRVREYLRFVYLTQISGTPLTPSKKVDEVWHLHLTMTRDYWEVFCAEVIGAPLHHDAASGAAADAKHAAQYADTLALYVREFGAAPPDDIWPRGRAKRRQPVVGTIMVGLGAVFMAFGASGGPFLMLFFGVLGIALGLFVALIPQPVSAAGCSTGGGCGSGADCGGGGCGGD
jgi:hypothetical protein